MNFIKIEKVELEKNWIFGFVFFFLNMLLKYYKDFIYIYIILQSNIIYENIYLD